jgi:hypothetical protein
MHFHTSQMPPSDFMATCLDLLEWVKRTGQLLLILKRGEPIAQVIPPPPPSKLESWLGSFKDTGTITGDAEQIGETVSSGPGGQISGSNRPCVRIDADHG